MTEKQRIKEIGMLPNTGTYTVYATRKGSYLLATLAAIQWGSLLAILLQVS